MAAITTREERRSVRIERMNLPVLGSLRREGQFESWKEVVVEVHRIPMR
jgi:hypothetical protein